MTHVVLRKIPLSLSNAFLVLGERPVLVDAGSPREEGRILRQLAAWGVAPRDVALIVLTHAHADHAGAAAALRRATGAPIALHPDEAQTARDGRMPRLRPVRARHHLLWPLVNRPFEPFEADLTLGAAQRLDAHGLAASVLETPGHSPGSVSLLLDGGGALAGDLLIGGYAGGLVAPSRPRLPYFADDLPTLLRSAARLVALAPGGWHVGHGGPLPADAVRSFLSRA